MNKYKESLSAIGHSAVIQTAVIALFYRRMPIFYYIIGRPIPFDTDKSLYQLRTPMTAAYDGREDKIRELVAEVVGVYQPAGVHGSEHQDTAYAEQIEFVTNNVLDAVALA